MTAVLIVTGSEEYPQYLKSYDVDARDGRGEADFTDNINEALHFPTAGEAFDAWRTQSKKRPLRPDGKPNRPLTAFTMTVETLKEGGET
jgi:hypothetical protein